MVVRVSDPTIKIPDGWAPDPDDDEPLFSFVGGDDDISRDVSKPVAYDEHGRPLYAPRGFRLGRLT